MFFKIMRSVFPFKNLASDDKAVYENRKTSLFPEVSASLFASALATPSLTVNYFSPSIHLCTPNPKEIVSTSFSNN